MTQRTLEPHEQKHIELLRGILPECTVLLKRSGAFPLAGSGKIALYGSGVRKTIKGGTGSGEVNSRYYDTVEAGFEQAGFTVTTKAWLDGYDRVVEKAQQEFNRQLRLKAKEQRTNVMLLAMGAVLPEPEYELPLDAEGDAALYVLSRISGEGTDRKPEPGEIQLTPTELRDIRALSQKFERFMLVLNVGGVVDLSPVMDDVPDILLLSQLGVETGSTLARLVLGQQYPSGKLTTTWAAWEQYAHLDYGGYDDTRYKEGVYVGYRWFDSAQKPVLFPFGYGLGYTDFKLTEVTAAAEKTRVTVAAKVTNTGSRPGKEVVQVYVSVPGGALDQPYQMLAAWVKTPELAPGEGVTVEAGFDLTELAGYDPKRAAYVLEGGDYILRVGAHSRNTVPAAAVRLDRDVVVRQVKNALGTPDFSDFVPAPLPADAGGLPVLEVSAAEFAAQTVDYAPVYPIDDQVKQLTDEELALLSNGHFGKGGMLSMIGNASSTVCGAAGETAHVAGFPVIVMADGPAGIRINQRYFEDKKGIHSMEPPFPQSMVPFMPAGLKFLMEHFIIQKPKHPEQVRYQYCTALPIGTALAQSWNLAAAEQCGDIVGSEMERFCIDLWLAPALNIHRSPQCGRNFEYYSEDPLISGKFAAAVTRGVQKHPGKGVTIKHYAANNQEFNRTSSNSMVSERAMREIYLKGFEIAVREGRPAAVMTSYNLLNGQHTSTRRDLIEDVLRCEFGFEGVVMTDWVVQGGMIPKDAKYPGPTAAEVAAAGGDLFMPGSKNDRDSVLNALRQGSLSKEQLQINATRVLALGRKTETKK